MTGPSTTNRTAVDERDLDSVGAALLLERALPFNTFTTCCVGRLSAGEIWIGRTAKILVHKPINSFAFRTCVC